MEFPPFFPFSCTGRERAGLVAPLRGDVTSLRVTEGFETLSALRATFPKRDSKGLPPMGGGSARRAVVGGDILSPFITPT